MDEISRDILAILDRRTGIGIFSKIVELPGQGSTRYWFSLASGMASLQGKIGYRSRFDTLPDWVSQCHPDHQTWLCRRAIQANQALPAQRPVRPLTETP
jgi:hypothetical protein